MKNISSVWHILSLALLVGGAPACDALNKQDASAEKDKDKKADQDDDDESDSKSKKKKKAEEGDSASKKSDDKPAATTEKAADAVPVPTATGNAPAAPVTDPSQQTYPDLPNKIADSCATPHVIMATAPNSVGVDYPWTWTRQAMLANQQFKVVSGEPAAVGEVSFGVHLSSDKFQSAWVLVAKCHDGGTCNKLAAMYKGVVKGSMSQPVCGTLPMDLSPVTFKKPVLRDLGDPRNTLPASSDTIGQCARLQACAVAMDPPAKAGKENIGFDCQKAPSNFKREDATRYPCSEVMACLK